MYTNENKRSKFQAKPSSWEVIGSKPALGVIKACESKIYTWLFVNILILLTTIYEHKMQEI